MELYPKIHYHFQESCTSTFDVLDQILPMHSEEILVVRSNEQLNGKGQRGKAWHSPKNSGIYISAHFPKLKIPIKDSACINWITSIECAEKLRSLGVQNVQIKWPNDIFTNHGKIGGILSFIKNKNQLIHSSSIGIGINLTTPKIGDSGLGVSSLQQEIENFKFNLDELSLKLIQSIAQKLYMPLVNLDKVFTKWLKYSYGLMRSFKVVINDEIETTATILGPQKNGGLLIEVEGEKKLIHSGNIKWLYEV
jgi:BirA family biotin operon repressor/biotin-[acetyl-CoA-carboxylase] ligase